MTTNQSKRRIDKIHCVPGTFHSFQEWVLSRMGYIEETDVIYGPVSDWDPHCLYYDTREGKGRWDGRDNGQGVRERASERASE